MTKEEFLERQLEKSEKFQENEAILNKFYGQRIVVADPQKNEILFLGNVDITTLKSLDDWPEDILITRTDEIFTVESILQVIGDKNVKIGARDGVGFLYCGKCRPGLYHWLRMRSSIIKSSIISSIEKIEHDIYCFDAEYFKNYISMRNCARTKNNLKPLTDKEAKEAYDNALRLLKQKLNRYEKKRDNFVDILHCPVIDIYRSVLAEEKGTYIIRFDGSAPAQGAFWTIAECNAEHRIQRELKNLEA